MPKSYALDMTNKAFKFLTGLESKQCKQVAIKMLSLLRNPYPNDSEQLKGPTKYRRVDIGEYRIVYDVQDNVIQILAIGPRNDGAVCKRF
jgi:mRNA interferase RelE/StbE